MVITFFCLSPKVSHFYVHFCVSMTKIHPTSHRYPAKLMLFGEYTALLGGGVLATPMTSLWAYWDFGQRFPHPDFKAICLQAMKNYPFLVFDEEKWDAWIEGQGFLRSEVPVGYGLGSSGNLVAAIFDGFFYFSNSEIPELSQLKSILGFLESYFHGSSSGVDPLVSYVQKTLLFTASDVQPLEVSAILLNSFKTIDSGRQRNTEVLVKDFKERLQLPSFANAMEKLAEINNMAIEAMVRSDKSELKNRFWQISEAQFKYLNHLITPGLQLEWKAALDSGEGLLKICGAGGGGYYLQWQDNG